jgi:hypothetical protein
MQKYIGILISSMIALSCMPKYEDNVRQLEGTWIRHFNDNQQIEKWISRNDSLIGEATFIRNGIQTTTEHMFIYEAGGELIFTADVPENVVPVSFRLTDSNENGLLFENPEHDFPQFIRYQVKGDSMYAAIGGTVNGFDKTAVFDFIRASE